MRQKYAHLALTRQGSDQSIAIGMTLVLTRRSGVTKTYCIWKLGSAHTSPKLKTDISVDDDIEIFV